MGLRNVIEESENIKDNSIVDVNYILKKYSKRVIINLTLKNALPFKMQEGLTTEIREFLKPLDCGVIINLKYEEMNLGKDELLVYTNIILNSLEEETIRIKALRCEEPIVDGKNIVFTVADGASGLDDLLKMVEDEFKSYGLDVDIIVKYDESNSLESQLKAIDNKIDEDIATMQRESEEATRFNKVIKDENKKYKNARPSVVTRIKEIPATIEGLNEYMNMNGQVQFMVEGHIFGKEIKTFPGGKSAGLITLKITDESDSIVVSKWLRTEVEKDEMDKGLSTNTQVRVIGKAEYDTYVKSVIIKASTIEIIGKYKVDLPTDDSEEKRVELHLHTKMSALDGVTDASEYVKAAASYGWRGIGLTDLNGVYAIPDIEHAIEGMKLENFKPIYGTELSFVDDSKYFITFNKEADINLKEATFVVYDIETTGLSQTFDEIIEIAAYKVRGGVIIDQYEVFVNPKRPIPPLITNLTSITDDMVKDAKTIDEVLPEFLEYCSEPNTILVAHNAIFDVGMIYAKAKENNIDFKLIPAIDTLNLFRAGYGGLVKAFNLKVLSKFFKVKQEQHHRATDDTRVLALCFIQMLNDLYQKNIFNYNEIDSLINKDEHWKYLITKESHITFLALNPKGKKNLYKLVSDALTVHMHRGEAKALRSVIEKYREGILVGSASANGVVFTLAATRSLEELKEAIQYYDYIEVSPPSCYQHMYQNYQNGKDDIELIIKKIIDVAKSMGKIVVATSDCYYLRPSDKHYRDILIASPKLGGGQHDLANAAQTPNAYMRTTSEMLNEFSFLDPELAHEIVITNTNKILDMAESYKAFSPDMFAPRDDQFKDNPVVNYVKSINEESRRIVSEHVKDTYGDNPHPIIIKRVERELNSIIKSGYMSVYYISHLLVKKSLEDGYLVGSRGSVGSSLVATMMDITEVNPLKPHYVCKKCKFHTFKMTKEEIAEHGIKDIEAPFQEILQSVDSGFDLPDQICPVCGNKMSKNGQDIPFETFLGFEGDKTPDIDLNFSGDYQATAHEYIRQVFGNDNAFRGGTVATIAEKVGYGYVKAYCEKRNVNLRDCEIDRLATHIDGVRRSTGQHPGGIVVVPNYVDIYDVTPFQYPADDPESVWRTTHYDYHKFEANLLKFDILGHDDPTIIRYLMNYVNAHQDEFPFTRAQDIPIDDPNLYKLFMSTESIGVKKEDLGSEIASYGVPELGTNFVQKMLIETHPSTFAQLIKISGLSHGTDVWNTNAQDLINGKTEFGKIDFKDVIGCRDDIMVDLMRMGLAPKDAFDIMEFVRKGKLYKGGEEKWAKYVAKMREANVPEWYIFSCSKIKYMFPKAHAIAYVIMALRIAWFKVYYPVLFYSAWLSKRAKGWNVQAMLGGPMAIRSKIEEIKSKGQTTATEDDLITSLQISLEMTLRGIKFLPVDINKSSATTFDIEDGNLRIPFVAVDKLGESVAINIVAAREEQEFTSIADAVKRGKINQSLAEVFRQNHFFSNLPEEDKEKTEGLFAFL